MNKFIAIVFGWLPVFVCNSGYSPNAEAYPREDKLQASEHPWEISVSADSVVRKSPLVGEPDQHARQQYIAQLRYYGDHFFVDGEVGYTLLNEEHMMFNLIASPAEDFILFSDKWFKVGDTPQLAGLRDRDLAANGGVELLFDGDWGEGEVQLETDLSGKHKGQSLALNYGYTLTGYAWEFRPQVGLMWRSGNYVDYYYGVHEDEVRPGRPSYRGKPTWDWTFLIETRYRFAKEWYLVGIYYYERGGDGIVNSPLIDKKFYTENSIGVEWIRPFSIVR